MPKFTIRDAILTVLKKEGKPLKVEEIYAGIAENDLYDFNTDQPIHVVRTRLRRDCEGLDFASANHKKYFQLLTDGRYWIKSKPIPKAAGKVKAFSLQSPLTDKITGEHKKYIQEFRTQLLGKIRALPPTDFEIFCKKLLKQYGFSDVEVTPPTRDGGLDGTGKLLIGFTKLNVAFECKRWSSKVDPKTVRNFRGAIPDNCVYGILFTTSTFSETAQKEASRPGYRPIVMFDENNILDFMIKNKFGVGIKEEVAIYVDELDLKLGEDDGEDDSVSN
jgi:restriction system protein